MRNFILLILLTCFITGFSQHSKVSVALKIALEKQDNPNMLFPLFVIGDVEKISQEVTKLKGEVIRSTGNVVQIKLPIAVIDKFSKNEFVEAMPYSFSKGVVLNDTMTIHNNITPIHNGDIPLLQTYTGKGVVFGIIDTGHDLFHPDFLDSLGNTRIYRILDQFTQESWDSTSINNGTSTHIDYHLNSHGTHVSGIAVGNGRAVDNYIGVAPEATIVVVANADSAANWLSTVVDAVDYIFSVADSLNLPCVINASIGDYFGSHDGTDPAALLIDSIVNYKPGRAFVCAGGNAGFFNWHVEQAVTADTSFSWLKYNASSAFGFGSVFYEVWSDTADFNNVDYAFGANLPSGTFEERGRTPFFNIQNRLGNFTDTIKNGANILAIVETYGELQGDKYLLQVMLNEPDSNTYNFSFLSTGSGRFDFWSTTLLGTSDVIQYGLPSAAVFPPIIYYTKPDSFKTTVSSFSCSPNIITVANFGNRKTYLDVDSIERVVSLDAGVKSPTSSIGPDRRGNIKPDIGATGDNTMAAVTQYTYDANLASIPANRAQVGFGGMHMKNGGTSMASPVVAGIVALYFEKCPNATMAEVKAAILGTGRQDVNTGTLPNPVFGYGKVDAFATLNYSNYNLTIGADQDICDGDSVQINSPSYSSYLWSTGETTQGIYLDTTTMAYVTVSNTSGCLSQSDTVNVVWHALPTKPIISMFGNDTLIYATNLNLQWYFNTGSIGGQTDTIHIAQNNGNYFVQVIDSFGCVNNSDTVSIVGVGIEDLKNDLFSIYPNPTTGKVYIEFTDEKIRSVDVINLLGEVLINEKRTNQQSKLELDLGNLAEGVYYIRLTTEHEKYLQKLILLR